MSDERTPSLWAIGMVKDENDIIGDCIDHALTICDRVFFLDNGSSDGSWETLQAKAAQYPDRCMVEQYHERFTDGAIRVIYNRYHHELPPDHWWMKIDSDEFLLEDPRPILRRATAAGKDAVTVWQVQFLYTDVDHARVTAGLDDPSRPIAERRRHYRTDWRETRLWRNFPDQPWQDADLGYPEQVRSFHSEHPLNRHYQYRTPDQIGNRLALRKGSKFFSHVQTLDWADMVTPASKCSVWEPGTTPRIHHAEYYRNLAGQKLRALRRLLTRTS